METKEDIISLKYKYERIQEDSEYLYSRIEGDEAQMRLLHFLSEFREIDVEVLKDSGVFYIEDEGEIQYLTGYDEETQYYLGFRNKSVNYEGRFLFPMRNGLGELNAWIGYDFESSSKYLVGMLGVGEKKRLMYGIDDIDMAYEEDTIIVNEGLFERIRLKEIGLNIGVSLLGKKMSRWQKQFLNRFKNIIIIPDGDSEGQDMIKQWTYGLTSNVCLVKLVEEKRYFNVLEEQVEKVVKDLDDKLRDNDDKVKDFLSLYEHIKKSLETEKYIEVEF